MKSHEERRALAAMRNLTAQGWHTEALLVDHAAEVLGGCEASKLTAQRVYDTHFRIMGAV